MDLKFHLKFEITIWIFSCDSFGKFISTSCCSEILNKEYYDITKIRFDQFYYDSFLSLNAYSMIDASTNYVISNGASHTINNYG